MWEGPNKKWIDRILQFGKKVANEARKDESERILEALKKLFKARKQQSEKIGGKYNLGRVVGIGECMRIIKKEMSKNE